MRFFYDFFTKFSSFNSITHNKNSPYKIIVKAIFLFEKNFILLPLKRVFFRFRQELFFSDGLISGLLQRIRHR